MANHLLLWISIQTRVVITLGIVFLKTTKPDLGGSLLTIGVAIVLRLASALLMPPMSEHNQAQSGYKAELKTDIPEDKRIDKAQYKAGEDE